MFLESVTCILPPEWTFFACGSKTFAISERTCGAIPNWPRITSTPWSKRAWRKIWVSFSVSACGVKSVIESGKITWAPIWEDLRTWVSRGTTLRAAILCGMAVKKGSLQQIQEYSMSKRNPIAIIAKADNCVQGATWQMAWAGQTSGLLIIACAKARINQQPRPSCTSVLGQLYIILVSFRNGVFNQA